MRAMALLYCSSARSGVGRPIILKAVLVRHVSLARLVMDNMLKQQVKHYMISLSLVALFLDVISLLVAASLLSSVTPGYVKLSTISTFC